MVNEKAMTPAEAGEFMNTLLPERTAQQWLNWLGNNRDPEREAVVRVPYGRMGRSRIVYNGDDLMEAATVLAVKSNVCRNRVGSTGALVPPAEKILPALKADEPTPAPVVEPITLTPVPDLRPGLELALKVIRGLPKGASAEHAIMVLLSAM